MNSLKNLIKTIKKIKDESAIFKIDDSFAKYKVAEGKYFTFIEEVEIDTASNQIYVPKNNRKASGQQQTIYNYFKPDHHNRNEVKNVLPLTKYKFTIENDRIKNPINKFHCLTVNESTTMN